jgi:hypothetical protein
VSHSDCPEYASLNTSSDRRRVWKFHFMRLSPFAPNPFVPPHRSQVGIVSLKTPREVANDLGVCEDEVSVDLGVCEDEVSVDLCVLVQMDHLKGEWYSSVIHQYTKC